MQVEIPRRAAADKDREGDDDDDVMDVDVDDGSEEAQGSEGDAEETKGRKGMM